MSTTVARLQGLAEDARERAVEEAAGALQLGRLVVFPTETIYGIAADATNPEALRALRAAIGAPTPDKPEGEQAAGRWWSWHAPRLGVRDDEADEAPTPDLPTAVARRLVSRLTPGPVRFDLEQSPARVRAIEQSLGLPAELVGAGVIGSVGDERSNLAVRVPDHPIARSLMETANTPIVAAGLGQALWWHGDGDDRLGRSVGSIASAHDAPLPAVVLDDGPTRFGSVSTLIRLDLSGRFEIASSGPVDEGDVMGALRRQILFVCTGNTCRSPMAEAIARSLLADRPEDGVTTVVRSAGVAAGEGIEAAPDAVRTMRERGIDLAGHRSAMVTREMIARAERIYTMTPSHAEALMGMAPEAIDKIEPIDPMGLVEDPVGRGLEVYRRTADQLEALIGQRLKELEP